MIRTLLIDIDTPDRDDGSRRWSSSELSADLTERLGEPVHVWGEVDASAVDGAFRKLRQLSRETENDALQSNRVHSAHKALSFFRDLWPAAWWDAHEPGRSR